MARLAAVNKAKKTPKYKVRSHHRCSLCGRARGYLSMFGICRICFRNMAHQGLIPGVVKASW